MQGVAHKVHEKKYRDRLTEQNDRENREHSQGVVDEHAPVEHHPDAHEKEHGKRVLQGERLHGRSVRKTAFAHHHAGKKGAERKTHVKNQRRPVGYADCGGQQRERKKFARPGFGNLHECPRNKAPAHDHHHRHKGCDLRKRFDDHPGNVKPGNRLFAARDKARGGGQQHEN